MTRDITRATPVELGIFEHNFSYFKWHMVELSDIALRPKGNLALSDQVFPPPSGPEPTGPEPTGPEPAGSAPGEVDSRRLLFTGGPRLGWAFRDRRELVPAYPEPKPGPETIQSAAAARTAAADARLARAWKWAGKPSIALALVLVLLAACARTTGSGGFSPLLALITGIVVCLPGLGYTGWCWLERDKARDIPPDQAYWQALSSWEQRAAEHQGAELARLAGQPEWGSVPVPPRRTDVFGGTLSGWQSLLAVHGASLLAGRPLLIADLTGLNPAAPLLSLAGGAGIGCVTWQLPADLGRSGILAGLAPAQMASAVAEALHAGTPGGARTERATDTSILEQLAGILTPAGVTIPRLAAAVRAALGQPAGPVLSAAEQEAITGSLFPPGGARDQAAPGLARLNAVLPGLAAKAGEGWPARPASCTCLTVGAAQRDAGTEVLAALLVRWLAVQVSTAQGAVPAVIVAGADQVTAPHLEQLADACELRGVPLTLLFRHLRGDAAQLLGGAAATAFMRLGNHTEAEQAAAYLGRHHTFAVSSFTATRGGSQTSTTGGGSGHGTGESASSSRNKGWQDTGFFGSSGSHSGGKSRTTGTSTSRNWSENWSSADGTNWSDAQGVQRVYEYRVEPAVLQDLPEQALLLADRGSGTLRLRAVECDPSIITLPGASTTPLPPSPSLPQGGQPAAVAGPAVAGPGAGPALGPAGGADVPGWPQAGAPEEFPAWPQAGKAPWQPPGQRQ